MYFERNAILPVRDYKTSGHWIPLGCRYVTGIFKMGKNATFSIESYETKCITLWDNYIKMQHFKFPDTSDWTSKNNPSPRNLCFDGIVPKCLNLRHGVLEIDDVGDEDDDDDDDDDDDEHGCRQVFWKCRKCDVAAQPRDVGNPQNTILLFST